MNDYHNEDLDSILCPLLCPAVFFRDFLGTTLDNHSILFGGPTGT